MFKHFCILISILLITNYYSQNESKKWYFGSGAGLDFLSSPPSTLAASSMSTQFGSASTADASGNLLFYTNGSTIWNKLHVVMANGNGIAGHTNGMQPSLILKQPGNSNIYYVFTNNLSGNTNGSAGLFYSVIDISLAAGNGSVITKNVQLLNATLNSGLAGTKQCNGLDYWIVVRPNNSTNYCAFQLTAAGVSTNAVISSIGTLPVLTNSWFSLKFSPNGKKFASHVSGQVHLLDFDNSTGVFSNLNALVTPSLSTVSGIEFSSDGSKLYSSQLAYGIIQYDLCKPTSSAIANSSVVIAQSNLTFFYMQLASDGKIYSSSNNFFSCISVINNPNATGTACNFSLSPIPITSPILTLGLPNFPSSYFYQKPPVPPFTHTSSMALGCYGAQFTALLPTFCAASSNSVTGLSWNFGDPGSGAANTSFASNPTHFYPSNGNYTVQLVLYYTCGIANDTLSQVVNINHNCLTTTSNSITCSALGSATITSAVGGGPFTFTWLPSNQTGFVTTNLQPGTHTVVTTDLSNNYTYSSTVYFAPLTPLTASISSTGTVSCFLSSNGIGFISNITGGSPTQNFLWNNGTQTTSVPSPTNLSAGNWTITVTDALTACQVYSVLAISQPPPLSPTLSISTPSICAGASAILSATNSGGTPAYTYTFINGPISFSSTITESISGTHVYTVQSTDANNCLSSATVSLDVIANPILNISNVSICPTAIANFTVSGAAGYTLSSTPLGLTVFTAPSPTAVASFTDAPLSNTIYTLTGTALGCNYTTTTSVFIYTSPTPIISSNSPKCEGSIAQISVSGGTSAVWSGPNIFSSNNVSNTITPIGLSNAGVYSTTITSAVGCTASANSTFVVNPTPTVSAAGSTVCTTQTMALFANAIAGSSYQWLGINNFNSLLQNPTLANPSLNRTGSYTVIVTAPTSCSNTAIAQVSVTSPPSLSIALSSNSLCAQAFNGSPNTITLTSSGANTYTLYTPNLLGSSTPIAPSASLFATPPFASTLAAGIATLQGSNGVCTSTASFVFTVVPNPTVGVNSFTPVICAGKNFTYTSNGASSYVWSATSPNYTTYSNGGVAVAHPSINAVFSVYGSSLGCSSALVSSSITVFPLPTITLSALSSSICLYDKTNLSVSGTGTSFQWLPLTGLNAYTGSLVNCGTQVNQVYTVIASANNCTAAATTSIHVWPLPIAKITSITNSVCLHDNIKLSGEGGVQFNWFGPGNIAVGGQSVSINAWSPGVGGTYTLVVTDINSCKSATTTNISILALPNGSLKNFKEEVCAPYCATYNFEGFNSKNIQSTWVINSSTITGNLFSTCFKEAGTYTLQGKLLDNSTSCKSEISYVVNVRPKPSADFLFLPRTPIENLDEVVFNNTSSGDGLLTYHWHFNDNKGFSTTNKNTSYLYSEPGDYRVVLVAKNNFNCADTILKIIHVEPDFALYVPNTFTPNDDNRNDVFLASVRSSKLFDLKIYDRWGAELFHSKSPSDGWDGTFRGTACKQDTYTWVIELSSVGGERVVKTGTALLLR